MACDTIGSRCGAHVLFSLSLSTPTHSVPVSMADFLHVEAGSELDCDTSRGSYGKELGPCGMRSVISSI